MSNKNKKVNLNNRINKNKEFRDKRLMSTLLYKIIYLKLKINLSKKYDDIKKTLPLLVKLEELLEINNEFIPKKKGLLIAECHELDKNGKKFYSNMKFLSIDKNDKYVYARASVYHMNNEFNDYHLCCIYTIGSELIELFNTIKTGRHIGVCNYIKGINGRISSNYFYRQNYFIDIHRICSDFINTTNGFEINIKDSFKEYLSKDQNRLKNQIFEFIAILNEFIIDGYPGGDFNEYYNYYMKEISNKNPEIYDMFEKIKQPLKSDEYSSKIMMERFHNLLSKNSSIETYMYYNFHDGCCFRIPIYKNDIVVEYLIIFTSFCSYSKNKYFVYANKIEVSQ